MSGERWLTTRTVDALSVRTETLFRDRELAGFAVRVEPSGRKIYAMETAAGWVALGRHGTISADGARRRAAALLAGEPPAEPTVAEVAERYLREYVEVRCKPATVAQYRLTLTRHVLPALGGVAIAAIGREQVAALQHRLSDRPAAANQAVATLARLIEHAADRGLVPAAGNPGRAIPKYRVRRRERFLTETEFRRLGRALDTLEAGGGLTVHAAAAIRLLALTGCRRNEILTLRWGDVRLDANEIRLRDSKTGPRIVPLSPAAAKILAELPRMPGNPHVVPGRKPGAPVSGIFLQWRRARRLAGLDDVRLHDLRHSFASRALALGENLPTIARLLGHARVQTTSRYAHLARPAVKEAAARVAADIGADIMAKPDPGGCARGALADSAERIAARIGADIGADLAGGPGYPDRRADFSRGPISADEGSIGACRVADRAVGRVWKGERSRTGNFLMTLGSPPGAGRRASSSGAVPGPRLVVSNSRAGVSRARMPAAVWRGSSAAAPP